MYIGTFEAKVSLAIDLNRSVKDLKPLDFVPPSEQFENNHLVNISCAVIEVVHPVARTLLVHDVLDPPFFVMF
jgi:hypothetical protein